MAISWDPALVTGYSDIDEQHQELFRRLDALIDAIRGGRSRDEIGRTLAFLEAYVGSHFGMEEALMQARAYPGVADHKAEHESFVDDLRALKAEFQRDGATPSLIIRVNTHLSGWLRSHIFRTDRSLAAFLSEPPAPPKGR